MFSKTKDNSTEFKSYFDRNWVSQNSYFEEHRTRFYQTWSYLNELEIPRAGGTALEIGGIGPLGQYLSQSRDYTVFESKTDLRYALPFENDRFDLVICTEVIEHIKDVDSQDIADLESFNYSGVDNMLREIGRTLKSEGKLFITTPNANSYITLAKWLTGKLPLMHAEHVREFSIGELSRVVAEAGLTVGHITTHDSWKDTFYDELVKVKSLMRRLDYPAVERGDNIFATVVKK